MTNVPDPQGSCEQGKSDSRPGHGHRVMRRARIGMPLGTDPCRCIGRAPVEARCQCSICKCENSPPGICVSKWPREGDAPCKEPRRERWTIALRQELIYLTGYSPDERAHGCDVGKCVFRPPRHLRAHGSGSNVGHGDSEEHSARIDMPLRTDLDRWFRRAAGQVWSLWLLPVRSTATPPPPSLHSAESRNSTSSKES